MTTAAPEPQPDGNWECVRPPLHVNEAHYWVRLRVGEAS